MNKNIFELDLKQNNISLKDIKYKFTFEIEKNKFYNLFYNENKISFKLKNIYNNEIKVLNQNISIDNLNYNYNRQLHFKNDYIYDFTINNINLTLSFNKMYNTPNRSDDNLIYINPNLLNCYNKKIKLYTFADVKKLLLNSNYFFDFDVDIVRVKSAYNECYFTLLLRNIYIYEINNNLINENENNNLINDNENNQQNDIKNQQIEIKNKIIELINENNNLKKENNELKNKNNDLIKENNELKVNNEKNKNTFINDINELLNLKN